MRSNPLLLIAAFTACAWLTPNTAATQDGTDAPAYVAHTDGTVVLEREGVAEAAAAGMPFLPGDALRSSRGRVEVLFAQRYEAGT